MTLCLSVQKFNFGHNQGYLFVQTSLGHTLMSPRINPTQNNFAHPFKINCSHEDSIKILFCRRKSNFLKKNYDAQKKISVLSLIRIHKVQLLSQKPCEIALDLQKQRFQLHTEVKKQILGTISCNITYDRVKYYLGEFISSPLLWENMLLDSQSEGQQNFNSGQAKNAQKNRMKDSQMNRKRNQKNENRKQSIKKNKIQIYSGACLTKNLFSFFDADFEGQNNKIMQSIYNNENKNEVSQ